MSASQIAGLIEIAKEGVKRTKARAKKKKAKVKYNTRDYRGVDGQVDDADSSGPSIADHANGTLQERDMNR